jgi:hypothetical protein
MVVPGSGRELDSITICLYWIDGVSHNIPFKQRESDIDTDPGISESKADITSID